jgi:hypothetical protein
LPAGGRGRKIDQVADIQVDLLQPARSGACDDARQLATD